MDPEAGSPLDRTFLTILICTHYMDEADRLCNRLAIVDHGKIVALGTPRELKSSALLGKLWQQGAILGVEQVWHSSGQ